MSKKIVLNNFTSLLTPALAANGYNFTAELQQKLNLFLQLLQRWNQAFNLTAITDPHDMVFLHIIDSLSISPYLHGSSIIDVGTGAGLPGIPLAILNSDKHFVLLDSNSKKIKFINQVRFELGIKNIEPIHSRCEDFKPAVGFDSVVSRAFSSIAVMLERTQHLIKDDGQFLAMKGIYPTEEIQAIPESYKLIDVHKLVIKGLAAERHVACIQKN